MTIITYKNGKAASDDLLWVDDVIIGRCQKIFHRPRDGAIVSSVGDAAAGDAFITLALKSRKNLAVQGLDSMDDGTSGILFHESGTVELWSRLKNRVLINCDFYAIGSGSEMALGLMAAGSSASEAAIQVCRYRGWPAVVTELDHDGGHNVFAVNQLTPAHYEHAPLEYKPHRN
jgi:hypothetical protein